MRNSCVRMDLRGRKRRLSRYLVTVEMSQVLLGVRVHFTLKNGLFIPALQNRDERRKPTISEERRRSHLTVHHHRNTAAVISRMLGQGLLLLLFHILPHCVTYEHSAVES